MSKFQTLYELIHSLTLAEKKFHRAISHVVNRKNKSYDILFEIIVAQKKLDEKHAKQLYIQKKATAQFPFAMSYLYSSILKSLQCYEVQKGSFIEHFEEVYPVSKILRQKNLQRHLIKILDKAIVQFVEKQEWLSAMQLFPEYYEAAVRTGIQNIPSSEIRSLLKLEAGAYDAYQLIYKTKQLDTETAAAWDNYAFIEEKQKLYFNKRIKEIELSIKPDLALSAQLYFKEFCVKYYIFTHQHEKAYSIVPELTQYYSRNKKNADTVILPRYLRVLNLHLTVCMETFRLEEFYKVFELFEAIPHQDKTIQNIWLHHRVKIIKAKICEGRFEEALTEWNYIEAYREEKKIVFAPIFLNSFRYYLAMLHFGRKEYKLVLDTLYDVLRVKKTAYREDVYQAARLLEIMTYFELAYFELLEGNMQAAMKYYSKNGQYKFYNIALKMVKLLIQPPVSSLKTHNRFLVLYKSLEELFLNSDRERSAQNYLNIMAWMMSKRDNITFTEALLITAKHWRGLEENSV